jgi:hypothetical protein
MVNYPFFFFLIHLLHISDLILKLYVFKFFIRVISLTTRLMVPILERAIEFEYNFLTICSYLNLVKKSDDNFIATRKFTSCYNVKIWH